MVVIRLERSRSTPAFPVELDTTKKIQIVSNFCFLEFSIYSLEIAVNRPNGNRLVILLYK